MKINVTCIYWFLLLISFGSSCLLFILVASEGVQTSSSITSENLQQNDEHEINISEGGKAGSVTPENIPEADVTTGADLRSSFDEVSPQSDNAESNKEFVLSHNSGLSNGLSDTGQAVVFTLVDTASAELQQRADTIPTTPATHITQALTEDKNNNTSSSSSQLNFTPTVLVQTPPTPTEASEVGTGTVAGVTTVITSAVENEENNNNSSVVSHEVERDNTHHTTSSGSSENYIVRAEPKVLVGKDEVHEYMTLNKTEEVEIEVKVVPEIVIKSDDKEPTKEEHEDIPSFSEWTQKQLEEAEKKKEKVNTSAHSHHTSKPSSNLKLRSKNYASPDCGAKIVAANPEAISAGSVLSPSRDEYKLNACTSRVWFVVELCEAIQAKKIDLANFELFSSSPKDFTVSVSDRFPSRDWSSVGQFQAKDERDIQSFNLHPHLFGKFIKVEMLSHWGSEHFCPISLFRVYGTSEFEVLETEDLVNENVSDDDDDDETLDSYKGEPANNLFGSARDAVMSIVKKAAEVLVKSGDNGLNRTFQDQIKTNKYSPLINTCSTPSHLVVCDNCSDILFGNVYELLSCNGDYLRQLINIPIVNKSLYNTDICVEYGLNFYSKSVDKSTDSQCSYISSFFAPKYIAALCNVLAVLENKVVLNISNQYSNTSSSINNTLTNDIINLDTTKPIPNIEPAPSCPSDETVDIKTCASRSKTSDPQSEPKPTVIIEDSFIDTPIEMQINPTKTLSKDNKVDPSFAQPAEDSSIVSTRKEISLDPSESVHLPNSVDSSTIKISKNNTEDDFAGKNVMSEAGSPSSTSTVTAESVVTTDSSETFEIGHDQLDKLLSELNLETDSPPSTSTSTTVAPPNVPQQAQKESVFLRLSNRIKTLERNMSLSGQYLEELSRRYKKQVEEMQRAFEKKLAVISEENKKREERELRLQEQLEKLTSSVESLITERDSMWKTASLLGQFLLMEVFVTCLLLYFCWKTPDSNSTLQKQKKQKNGILQVKRRKSIDTIGHESPVVHRKRRPSEEALKISGTYEDLLITDDIAGMSKAEKRRRRKKNALLRSQSVVGCKLPIVTISDEPTRRASSSDMMRKPNLIIQPQVNTICINGDISPPAKIQDIPFVLEESEHVAVEPIIYFKESTKPETMAPTHVSIKSNLNKISKNGSIKSSILKAHSPLFMKTALSSRSKRNSTSKRLSLFKTDSVLQNSSHRKSPEPSIQSNSFSISDSQDDQMSLNSDSSKKDKKIGSFKRIFKRVFE